MRPTIEVNQRDALNFNEKLAMLALPRRKRTWILKTLGRWERQNTRQRIRQQKGIDGQALEQRKNGRKKVMRRMAKGLEPYVRHNATELDLTWKNKLIAQIAARHYLGQAQRVTARQMEKRFGKPDYNAPASRGMARKLREVGYTVSTKSGRGRKKPTLKWIQANLSHGQCGLLIRQLSNKPQQRAWDIPLPERQILGSNQTDVNRQLVKIFEQAKQRK
ncbi:virion morphogenesis protein [Salinivibrio sp. VYel6]|uniref:virion morphogenesis protein n=1 Tax=Salinivibrio sp. VYel6 TaxID=2490493 RepID=UPI00128E31AA|nr:virion morphogenesis protein [Salinivibrio sp. VYel6]MPX98299.1 virion morphogenesis protein [Salinivibrio sp. VYel6]